VPFNTQQTVKKLSIIAKFKDTPLPTTPFTQLPAQPHDANKPQDEAGGANCVSQEIQDKTRFYYPDYHEQKQQESAKEEHEASGN